MRTKKGREAAAKLREADVLMDEVFRIKQAVEEGLLPKVSMEQAEKIERDVCAMGKRAAAKLDQAEGWA